MGEHSQRRHGRRCVPRCHSGADQGGGHGCHEGLWDEAKWEARRRMRRERLKRSYSSHTALRPRMARGRRKEEEVMAAARLLGGIADGRSGQMNVGQGKAEGAELALAAAIKRMARGRGRVQECRRLGFPTKAGYDECKRLGFEMSRGQGRVHLRVQAPGLENKAEFTRTRITATSKAEGPGLQEQGRVRRVQGERRPQQLKGRASRRATSTVQAEGLGTTSTTRRRRRTRRGRNKRQRRRRRR